MKFPLNFINEKFQNENEIDDNLISNVKERILEIFFICNDLLKIQHVKFGKMMKNIFLSYFIFPLLLEIIKNPKHCQMRKKNSALLFLWFIQNFENKKYKNLLVKLLLKDVISYNFDLNILNSFAYKASSIDTLNDIFNREDEFIDIQLDNLYKERSHFNKMSLKSFEKIPSFTQRVIKHFKSSVKIEFFRNFTKNTGQIAFLDEKEKLKKELSKSPLVILKKKQKEKNIFKRYFFENLKNYNNQDLAFIYVLLENIFKTFLMEKNKKLVYFTEDWFFNEFLVFLFKKIFQKQESFPKFTILKFLILLKKLNQEKIILKPEFVQLLNNVFEIYREKIFKLSKEKLSFIKFSCNFEHEYYFMVNLLKKKVLEIRDIWNFFPLLKERESRYLIYQNFYCKPEKDLSHLTFLYFHFFLFLQRSELISNYFSEFYTMHNSINIKTDYLENLEFEEIYIKRKFKNSQTALIKFYLYIGDVQLIIFEKTQENKKLQIFLNLKYKFFKIKSDDNKIHILNQKEKTKITILVENSKSIKIIYDKIILNKNLFYQKEEEFLFKRLNQLKTDFSGK